ncbi:MAG: ABC transporter substrate-binding protein, partial [Desulfurobacteriaceae bacterium]
MNPRRKFLLFLSGVAISPFAAALFYAEPRAKREKYEIGKSVDLDRVTFLKGKYGGTIYSATSSDPKTFNLVAAHETSSTEAVGELFEGLTEIDLKTLKPVGALAEGWEFKDGGLRWIFYLRKG